MVENYGHAILSFNEIIIISLTANSNMSAGRHIDLKMTIKVGVRTVFYFFPLLIDNGCEYWFVILVKHYTVHLSQRFMIY